MKDAVGGPLLVGLIMAYFGLILIALSVWHALRTKAEAIMHAAGGLLHCAGQCASAKKNQITLDPLP